MFVHLHLHSPYSFLDGASELEALVRKAASFGMPALALTDHDSLAAAVKFTLLCRAYGLQPILGAEVTLEDGSHLTLLAEDRAGYANLGRLLTLGYQKGGRLTPGLPFPALERHAEGLVCLSGCRQGLIPQLLRQHQRGAAEDVAEMLRNWFTPACFYIELQEDGTPYADLWSRELADLARHLGVGVVATNNVHYADPEGFVAHDLLRCIHAGVTTAAPHPDRPFNNERYLKSGLEMLERFHWCPEALANTRRIAERCADVLPEGEAIPPRYPVPAGRAGVPDGDAAAYLRYLTLKGAKHRYGRLSPALLRRIDYELGVIGTLGYADYVLMCWEAVRWARREGIRATGRGSAADSVVAYALQLTDVDAFARGLPFARFLVPGKTPDIDVDFPHDRRDEVFRHLQERYGEENVGMCCTFFTYGARGAVRDLGKALGLPPDVLQPLSAHLAGFLRADGLEDAFGTRAELKPYAPLVERFRILFDLCGRIAGFPRHMGTHSSGAVVSRVPLATLAPLTPSAKGVLPLWTLDKDDAEAVGALKFDVLSLRTLAAVQDAVEDIRRDEPTFQYARIPHQDPQTYRMLRAGAAVGSFQLESAAQLSLAAVLQPEHFEDLVASVALIRPGPIRGKMVQRFVACRNGWARADCLHPGLVPILARTYGVICYQEQVTACVAAMTGLDEVEADRFRKRLAHHERWGTLEEARDGFLARAFQQHPDLRPQAAEALWQQIAGWGSYGLTEGHAAAFALTGYRTAYMSVHHAAAYFAGLLNHQPMGYYSANTLAAEARRRGVRLLPVDINHSGDKSETEPPDALRLGLRLVAGLGAEDIQAIVTTRESQGNPRPYASLLDFCGRVPLARDRLENLVLCGAFEGLHPHRRGLLWRLDETLALARSYRAEPGGGAQEALSLGSPACLETPCAGEIADFDPWEKFRWTWRLTGVAADAHPFAWMRERLGERDILSVQEAAGQKAGTWVTVAGLNIRPHRPPTRSGKPVLFTILEDETGLLEAACLGEALPECVPVFLTSPAVVVAGRVRRRGAGVSLEVERARPLVLRERTGSHQERETHGEAPPGTLPSPTVGLQPNQRVEHYRHLTQV